MKINWGTGIVIAIVIMIGGFIYLASIAVKQDYDLVETDYYQKSVNYQKHIDEQKNTEALESKIQLKQSGDSLKLSFPKLAEPKDYQGQIHIYSPVSEKRDFTEPVRLEKDYSQSIDLKKLQQGRYQVKMEWRANQVSYYQEEEIRIGQK